MRFLRGLLDRLLLMGAIVAGGLVPGFIAQYRQRLGGRLDQAQLDLKPWQDIADRFHHGDLQKLIQHHLDSSDPTFRAEGAVIRGLATTVEQLRGAVEAMQTSLFEQAGYLALHGDPGLARATWADWVPAFALSLEGILFALLFAAALWVLFHAVWELFALIGRLLFVRRSRPAGHPWPTRP